MHVGKHFHSAWVAMAVVQAAQLAVLHEVHRESSLAATDVLCT